MLPLILCLLLETPDEARAKAILTWAAAAAQAKRQPPAVLIERLTYLPAEARPPKPKPDLARLTLEEGAVLAAKARLPLFVWVGGYDDAELRSRLPKCVQVRVETWKGSADKGVVACPLYGGGPLGLLNPPWPHARQFIPAKEAGVDEVLKELLGAWLRSAAPVKERPEDRRSFSGQYTSSSGPRWTGGAALRGSNC